MLEIANSSSILRILGKFELLNFVGHCVDSKKAHPCVISHFLPIVQQNHFSRQVRG